MLVALRLKELAEVRDLCLANGTVQRNEEVGLLEIALILRNLIFQHEMIPERIPRQLGEEAMVLVAIGKEVRKHQVGLDLLLQRFEAMLDSLTLGGEEGVPEISDNHSLLASAFQEGARAGPGLAPPGRPGAEYHPPDIQAGPLLNQLQNRAPATDLDVIGMRSEAQDTAQLFET